MLGRCSHRGPKFSQIQPAAADRRGLQSSIDPPRAGQHDHPRAAPPRRRRHGENPHAQRARPPHPGCATVGRSGGAHCAGPQLLGTSSRQAPCASETRSADLTTHRPTGSTSPSAPHRKVSPSSSTRAAASCGSPPSTPVPASRPQTAAPAATST